MKYDFTSIIDRHGKDAVAVDPSPTSVYRRDIVLKDGIEDHIPMWVADMNFATVPTVQEAIIERVKHPTFGYFTTRDEYYDSIIRWHETRNGVEGLAKEHIAYENGVLGGVVNALRILCSQGDNVLIHTPTYVGFTAILAMNGYKAVQSPLVRDENGVWRMDYEDMDKKIKQRNVHAAIFCSPHNPTGRVWERWEIEKAMEVFRANDVFVISDEIWSDIILFGNKHIPTQSVSEDARNRTMAFYAPSKTFNLAGLIGSYRIVYNKFLRDRLAKESSLTHYNSINLLSMYAQIGAYKPEGYEWVDELCQVLSENVEFAYNYIREHFEGVELFKPQGTYMLYLNCTEWCEKNGVSIDELQKRGYEHGVDWQDGRAFFMPNSIRMNLALPLSRVQEAFDRLDKYVFNA